LQKGLAESVSLLKCNAYFRVAKHKRRLWKGRFKIRHGKKGHKKTSKSDGSKRGLNEEETLISKVSVRPGGNHESGEELRNIGVLESTRCGIVRKSSFEQWDHNPGTRVKQG